MNGKVRLVLKNKQGNIIQKQHIKNMILNSGRQLMANLFAGQVAGGVEYLGIGTGISTTDPSMESLEAEARSLVPGTLARAQVTKEIRSTEDGSTVIVEGNFSGDNFVADEESELKITEAGLFTLNSEEGVLYNRVTFDNIPLRRGYELTLVWNIGFPS